jgi:hypothetical protein
MPPLIAGFLSGVGEYRTNEYAVSSEGRAAVGEAWGAMFRKWGYET